MTIEEMITPYVEMYEKFIAEQKPNITTRKTPLERRTAGLDFEETIGNTTYIVKSFFDDNSDEDVLCKIMRLMNGSKVNTVEIETE